MPTTKELTSPAQLVQQEQEKQLGFRLETKVALIVAAAENNVIGWRNAMPWHLPEELGYFKRTTLAKPLIMGRATFESIGRPLPGRTNIVLSRNPSFSHTGITTATSLAAAFKIADAQAILDGASEIMVIGGEKIYQQCLALAQRVYLTKVAAQPQGDAWFPELDPSQWLSQEIASFPAQEGNKYAYTLNLLERL